MAWIALIAEPDMAYGQLVGPLVVAGVRRVDGDPARPELGRRRGPAEAVGKAAGTNSMMRELGGVFGIAVAVAVFAGAGGYASPEAFIDGFAPAVTVAAVVALVGAAAGLALPGAPSSRRRRRDQAPARAAAASAVGGGAVSTAARPSRSALTASAANTASATQTSANPAKRSGGMSSP